MLIYLRAIPRSLLISNISPLYTDPTFTFLALSLFIQLKKLLLVKTSFAGFNTSLMEFSLTVPFFTVLVDSLFILTVFLKEFYLSSQVQNFFLNAFLPYFQSKIDRTLEDIINNFHYSFKVCANKKNISFLLLCMFLLNLS